MASLTKELRKQQKNMINLKSGLAKADEEMVDKKQDLKQTHKEKSATETFLADIKPGCDFIFDNFERRTKSRKAESVGLAQAQSLLKGSAAYQSASAEEEAQALADCRSKCKTPDHVECKACVAEVSIPGYCAGHKGTVGC